MGDSSNQCALGGVSGAVGTWVQSGEALVVGCIAAMVHDKLTMRRLNFNSAFEAEQWRTPANP
jgi:hypothetical protein